jgi:hypothetical protein
VKIPPEKLSLGLSVASYHWSQNTKVAFYLLSVVWNNLQTFLQEVAAGRRGMSADCVPVL